MELRNLGKYRLVEELAAPPGGNKRCRVFLANDEEEADGGSAGYLAKLLAATRGSEGELARASFEHEVKLLRSFNHPGIVALHAAGEQDGVPYAILDRVDGIPLARLLGHTGGKIRALSKELAVYIAAQLADALDHAHDLEIVDERGKATSLGVVHRDLCPANVLVSRSGDVVLCDFGAASSRWLDAGHDDVGAGAVAYAAPERAAGGPATRSSDLFALAVMLWEMLRGERCFVGDDDAQIREAVSRFDIGHHTRRVPGLSPKLGEIVRKNLDREPSRRYESAYQMLQRLAQSPEAQAAERSRVQLGELVAEALARA